MRVTMFAAPSRAAVSGARRRLLLGALTLIATCSSPAAATAATGQLGSARIGHAAGLAPGSATATLEQCFTALVQTERSATFAGEMTAIAGSVRMAMRIDLQVKLPGEEQFHTISAPGLGVWRVSDVGVRTYRYLRHITNLPAPASYRAWVRYRWLSDHGHVLKTTERRSLRCEQPSIPAGSSPMPGAPASGAGPSPSGG